ncbi:MAG: Pyrrolo-quinoline quinone [Candidatus Magnetoglobus multicellularis str. Araruama]|uniref:Pyrrolo-quinoline quinone n=1 Tax=Candidatus Magnetoglobus multicellularis str. Araruama TaxID=890399 RepID=A0A1V1P5Y4_9BACT|nr:MAG: Pyrrolo-quinoline quinone [Candidatus Magnetoglobus multicellularis str. Araruama]
MIRLFIYISFLFVVESQCLWAIDIPNTPLSILPQTPPPIVMLLIDDSTTMNASILAQPDNTVLSGYHYVFDDPDNHVLSSVTNPQAIVPSTKTNSWQARCCITNRMYYNPQKTYPPWPQWTSFLGTSLNKVNADMDCPRYHPMKTNCLPLDSSYLSTGSFQLANAHYFLFDDINGNNDLDIDEQLMLIELSSKTILAYAVVDPTMPLDLSNLNKVDFFQLEDSFRLNTVGVPMDYTSQRQNFANWFSFHRRKELCIKYHLGQFLNTIHSAWVGIYSFNRSIVSQALFIDNTQSQLTDNKRSLFSQIYSYKSQGGSSLRKAYQAIGDYLDTRNNTSIAPQSPFQQNVNGDSCRQAFVLMFTDGHYNGPSPTIGNRDCDGNDNDTSFDGGIYADPYENTFADITMYYYERDLAPDIPNNLPCEASHQHLIPLIIVFSHSSLPEAYQHCPNNCPEWPQPVLEKEQTVIDTYHAALNGRGLWLAAGNSHALSETIQKMISFIHNTKTITISASLMGQSIQTKTQYIETLLYSNNWTGDVNAYALKPDNQRESTAQWSAQKMLNQQLERRIYTYDGQAVVPFQVDAIDSLDISDRLIEAIRKKTLGSIVHGNPVIVNDTVWVAANDGMVHGFNIKTGREELAYIPKMLWPRLHLLDNHDGQHHYLIDGNLYVYYHNEMNLMTIPLGRGGKGLFCLNIDANAPQEMALWEYAPPDDPDLGYIQQAYIGLSNYNKQPVVIFGNGYNSDNRQAFLYILDALTGKPLLFNGQEISKGIALPPVGLDNGLSPPGLVDIDQNHTVDLIYAGDLQGNLWKFDCRSSNPNHWRVFFEDKHDNRPKPLFHACSLTNDCQSISIRPEILSHCDSRFQGYMVIFGTGQYLAKKDIHDRSIQSLYAIWDWSDYWQNQCHLPLSDVRHYYLGAFNGWVSGTRKPDNTQSNVGLLKRDIAQSENSFQEINWDPTAAKSYVGWYMDLSIGERIIFPLTYLGEKILTMMTFTPDHLPCNHGGTSNLYMINACSGQSFNNLFASKDMSEFFQPIDGILYPPSIQFYGQDKMVLYLSTSMPLSLLPMTLDRKDFAEIKRIFDGQLIYWKTY